MLDWDKNVDPEFAKNHFMRPQPVRPFAETEPQGYRETWICYRSDAYSAKELTVLPARRVTITDAGAYGLIMMQGRGTMGPWPIEAPALIRYGQLTHDEFFVSAAAAQAGVTISNHSPTDPIVMLKHFGPGNADLQASGLLVG